MSATLPIRIGIVTVSDRASKGVYEDRGGPAIHDCLTEILACPWEAVARVIPDEKPLIEETLIELCGQQGCCLVVTTGGTGPALRDVTPEATEAVCEKLLDGFDGHPVPADCRHSRSLAHRQPARQAERHPRLPARGVSGNSVLHRPARGALSHHQRERGQSVPAETVVPI
jgi:molybdenum cofactor synthesis domain-containing protein